MNEPLQTAPAPDGLGRAANVAATIFSVAIYAVMVWVVLRGL